MTKEIEFLEKQGHVFDKDKDLLFMEEFFSSEYKVKDICNLIKEYADQVSKEKDAEIDSLKYEVAFLKSEKKLAFDKYDEKDAELNELKESHKKDSVDFAEWITISGYYQLRRQEWTINILGEENKIYTSEQLYELYKQKF